jgi:peptidoglycan/xylan/chitin deacetylase (PgdA/CDA1 family)
MKLFLIIAASIILIFPLKENAGAKAEYDNLEIPVLMYHAFSEERQDSLHVHPEDFREHLEMLKASGYSTINDQDIIDLKNGKHNYFPEKPVHITMDDGYVSNYDKAFPILKDLNMQATIFTITERRDSNYSNHFTWEEAREMQNSGLVSIEHHTHNLHFFERNESGGIIYALTGKLNNESDAEYRFRIEHDLSHASNRIQDELGKRPKAFSFPFGNYNEEVLNIARENGLEIFYTIRPQMNTMENVKDGIMHRYNVHGNMSGKDLIAMLEKEHSNTGSEIFSDMNKGDLFAEEIAFLAQQGIINGFPDGTFRPEASVSRAEVAVMIGRIMDFDQKTKETIFKDVPERHYASGYIQAAAEQGIIEGFPGGEYRPYDSISRGDMALILQRAFQLENKSASSFYDVTEKDYFYEAVLALVEEEVTRGFPDGSFRPRNSLTRGEFSAFLARILDEKFK